MIRVIYGRYINNYDFVSEEKYFGTLEDLSAWIYKHAVLYKGKPSVYFYSQEEIENLELEYENLYFWNIRNEMIRICLIEDTDLGILFSSGRFTQGKKHMSKKVKEWCIKGKNGELLPQYKFVD